jgi:hypothetical protein
VPSGLTNKAEGRGQKAEVKIKDIRKKKEGGAIDRNNMG